MPFDREGTLRTAEKLIRQGKIDAAIAEYRKVVDDQPSDWNIANTLGDLYFRAKQTDKAVAEYGRIADHFGEEGFYSKAVALYRKILKIKPDDERSMWHLADISARQGLLVEARSNFVAVAQRRRARGDKKGEAEARIRLADLEGADLETRLAGARGRVELGDVPTAVGMLRELALELQQKGDSDAALRLLTEAATLDRDDVDLRRSLMEAFAARGDFDSARQYANSADELGSIAEELLRQGRNDEALSVLMAAADVFPTDTSLRVLIVKQLIARGDVQGARSVLTPEVAAADPDLLWVLAEMELRDGRVAEGTGLLKQILADDPSKRDGLVILGCSVAEVNPDAGFQCIEVAANAAIASDEWGSAAAALNEFVSRVPNHIPALMRLVEICVDGGLEATMHSAQAQLADAYLVVGAGAEARVIAEDLVAREPWERANIERFRRALTLLGESDIDAVIAERLSGQSPFTSTDFLWPAEPAGTEIAPMPIPAEPREMEANAADAKVAEPNAAELELAKEKAAELQRAEQRAAEQKAAEQKAAEQKVAEQKATEQRAAEQQAAAQQAAEQKAVAQKTSEPATVPKTNEPVTKVNPQSAYAIDLSSILGEDAERKQPAAKRDAPEIDLSDVLGGLKDDSSSKSSKPSGNIESVLKGFRDAGARDSSPEAAEQQLKLADSYLQMGLPDDAITALEAASRSMRHRFRAGAMIAKIYRDKGDIVQAIEWYERAAEAPSSESSAHHALLYDLATALEAHGESARALAVYLELQAEAGDYRDLPARLEHLTAERQG
jgi:Flp pilus assembly protein TadD